MYYKQLFSIFFTVSSINLFAMQKEASKPFSAQLNADELGLLFSKREFKPSTNVTLNLDISTNNNALALHNNDHSFGTLRSTSLDLINRLNKEEYYKQLSIYIEQNPEIYDRYLALYNEILLQTEYAKKIFRLCQGNIYSYEVIEALLELDSLFITHEHINKELQHIILEIKKIFYDKNGSLILSNQAKHTEKIGKLIVKFEKAIKNIDSLDYDGRIKEIAINSRINPLLQQKDIDRDFYLKIEANEFNKNLRSFIIACFKHDFESVKTIITAYGKIIEKDIALGNFPYKNLAYIIVSNHSEFTNGTGKYNLSDHIYPYEKTVIRNAEELHLIRNIYEHFYSVCGIDKKFMDDPFLKTLTLEQSWFPNVGINKQLNERQHKLERILFNFNLQKPSSTTLEIAYELIPFYDRSPIELSDYLAQRLSLYDSEYHDFYRTDGLLKGFNYNQEVLHALQIPESIGLKDFSNERNLLFKFANYKTFGDTSLNASIRNGIHYITQACNDPAHAEYYKYFANAIDNSINQRTHSIIIECKNFAREPRTLKQEKFYEALLPFVFKTMQILESKTNSSMHDSYRLAVTELDKLYGQILNGENASLSQELWNALTKIGQYELLPQYENVSYEPLQLAQYSQGLEVKEIFNKAQSLFQERDVTVINENYSPQVIMGVMNFLDISSNIMISIIPNPRIRQGLRTIKTVLKFWSKGNSSNLTTHYPEQILHRGKVVWEKPKIQISTYPLADKQYNFLDLAYNHKDFIIYQGPKIQKFPARAIKVPHIFAHRKMELLLKPRNGKSFLNVETKNEIITNFIEQILQNEDKLLINGDTRIQFYMNGEIATVHCHMDNGVVKSINGWYGPIGDRKDTAFWKNIDLT